MATMRQRKAVEKMIENGGIVSRAMQDAGYSEITSKTPKKLTESEGFKELLIEKGLTNDLIITSLVEDIKAKPQKRIGELSLGADILGLKKKNDIKVGVQINFGEDKDEYA